MVEGKQNELDPEKNRNREVDGRALSSYSRGSIYE